MNNKTIKLLILITVILMDILGGAELDLFIPSFPQLQEIFNLSSFLVESLLSINFLGFCLSLFFIGSLADNYGRKIIIIIGLIIFSIGSALCVWAQSYSYLLIGRFLQGIGVAAPATLCFLIISDLYPIKQQQFFNSMLNSLVNIAIGIAPLIGSYVTMYFNWQGNFIVLLIFGLIILIATIFIIPSSQLPIKKEPINLKGYLPILKSKPLMNAIICMVFMSAQWWVFIGIAPLLYMETLKVSIEEFGYYQGSLAIVFALASFLSSFILNKFDHKLLLNISYKICIISLILIMLITYTNSHNPLFITLAFIPFNIGTAIPFALIYPICLNYAANAKGKVAATYQILRLIFVAIGVQLTGYFYSGSFQNIGIIITIITIISISSLNLVIKNNEFMKYNNLS